MNSEKKYWAKTLGTAIAVRCEDSNGRETVA